MLAPPRLHPRSRRHGLGALALIALGLALFVAVSVIATGGRGLGFTGDGFLRGPRAPESTVAPAGGPAPQAPAGSALAEAQAEVWRRQRTLEEAMRAGDREAIAAAQEALAAAQRALSAARS